MSPKLPLILWCFVAVLHAQAQNSGFGVYQPEHAACLSPEQHATIVQQLAASSAQLIQQGLLPPHNPTQRMVTLFSWPIEQHNGLDDYGVHGISNFVDQNFNTPNQILDYNCGARSYDLASGYNHGGTDIYLWPFAWYKMDHDQVKVVAAAPGIIVYKDDGHFDRSCGFSNDDWNAVYVQHEDGSVAWYGHLKNGSVTTKNVGLSVSRGEYLGIVGSSGSSTLPHLHFEIHEASGDIVDPYAGPCNSTNAESWWLDQRPYFDSGVNAMRTQSSPTEFPPCPQTEVPHEQNTFCGNDLVYFTIYMRDQLPDQSIQYKILRPNGVIWQQWDQLFTGYYGSSWWYWYYTLPAVSQTGTWKFQAEYEGQLYERAFDVIGLTSIQANGPLTFCSGEQVTLQAPVSAYGFEYQWLRNGVDIDGANDAELVVTTGGTYKVVVSAADACSTTSNSIVVTVHPAPDITTSPESIAYICEGGNSTICAASGLDYSWNIGTITQCITVGGGEYIATVTSGDGCSAITIPVVVVELENPVVDLGADSIFSDNAVVLDAGNFGNSFFWSTGEFSQTITVTLSGWYSVIVTDDNGCVAEDAIYVDILFSSVDDMSKGAGISIHPNPTYDLVTIELAEGSGRGEIVVFDISGRRILQQAISGKSTSLDMSAVSSGLYLIRVNSDNRRAIHKLIKN